MRGLTSLSTTKCTRDCGSERVMISEIFSKATSFMNTIVISIISCSTHGSISAVFPITVGNSPKKDFGRVNADSFPEQRLAMEHTCFIIPFLVIFLRDLFHEITRCNLYSLRKQRIIYVVRKYCNDYHFQYCTNINLCFLHIREELNEEFAFLHLRQQEHRWTKKKQQQQRRNTTRRKIYSEHI